MLELNLLRTLRGFKQNNLGPPMPPLPVVAANGRISAKRAIYFHPVRCPAEVTDKQLVGFQPLFAHHFFGVKEEIIGFRELLIQIFYSTPTLDVYVKITGLKDDGQPVGQSDIERIYGNFAKVPFPNGFCADEAEFLRRFDEMRDAPWRPPVPQPPIATFTVEEPTAAAVCAKNRKSAITSSGATQHVLPPGDEANEAADNLKSFFSVKEQPVHEIGIWEFSFRDNPTMMEIRLEFLHRRLEWFLHFFIDACSNIDRDDRWKILLVFLRYSVPKARSGSDSSANSSSPRSPSVKRAKTVPSVDDDQKYCYYYEPAGVVTLYHFFALPSCRHRVSQFMILPHLQSRRVGLRVLQLISSRAIAESTVGELTVEDPAPGFSFLRDVVALRLCLLSGIASPANFFMPGTDLPLSVTKSLEKAREVFRFQFPSIQCSTAFQEDAATEDNADKENLNNEMHRSGTNNDETCADDTTSAVAEDSANNEGHSSSDKDDDDDNDGDEDEGDNNKFYELVPDSIPLDVAAETLLGNPYVRERIRMTIKESKHELNRLLDLFALARILPTKAQTPVDEELLRPIRVHVKRRIRLEQQETLEDMGSLQAVQTRLQELWAERFQGYKRVLTAMRDALLSHQALCCI